MTLGERIMTLRTERQMSQSDLAEALDVSRQSISKWETDTSVPELEKLVMLCDIFGVSMDMLVRGVGEKESEEPCEAPKAYAVRPETEPAPSREVVHVVKFETRKIAGILLFICAIVCALTGAFLGDPMAGIIMASPFIICGIICFVCSKRAGLWCAWTVYLLAQIFLRMATGVNIYYLTAFIKGDMSLTVHAIIAFAELVLTLLIVFFTVWSFRKEQFTITSSGEKILLAGWIALVIARVALRFVSPMVIGIEYYMVFTITKDWILYIALNILAVFTYHWWKGRREATKL
ncbi:MAG: helix-turn-helix transcriptional regulator [Firmicutes bacterium]|nr:helix-turn-helix transcriptional regulator [Bacillota bacterium]